MSVIKHKDPVTGEWVPILKGPQGIPGKDGGPGQPGYNPVRGTDYWTEADIAEIKAYCDSLVAGYNPVAVLSGTTEPAADHGNDGDIYLLTE